MSATFTTAWRTLCAVAAAALVGCQPTGSPISGPPASPLAVQTTTPRRGSIARTITLPTFKVLPLQEATLYAKVAGYLKTLSVDKGDAVTAGQLLAELEVPELLADEIQFQAELKVARLNYDRLQEAQKKASDLVVPQTVDEARAQAEVAQARLQRTRTLLDYTRIRAPFNGIITSRQVDPGAFIPAASAGASAQSAALVTLMDYQRVRVQVFVPEPETPWIKNGIPAKVTVEELPGRAYVGTVTRFAHALDSATKTMLAEIELENPGGELRPGMYASVQLELERHPDALLVPLQAVAFEKAGTSVFRFVDGKAVKTAVRIGFNDGTNAEILEGVKPEILLILLGKQVPNDGQPVSRLEDK